MPGSNAFFSVGFRPFYLGAAVFAATSIPFWVISFPNGTPPGLSWHLHEMVSGFAAAVIVGFLLTSVRAWTGLPTPSGRLLAALFGLWVMARLLGPFGDPTLFALVDLAFLPLAGTALAVPLWRARNRRNLFVLGILTLLWLASLSHHAQALGWAVGLTPTAIARVALDGVLLLMVVIGGRVIPAFAGNAVPGLTPRTFAVVEALAIGLVLFVLALDAATLTGAGVPAAVTRTLLLAATLIHLVRLLGWQPWKMLGNPLLLALPLAYLWIPVHLLLRAGAVGSAASHALVVGAMACLMLAMMTRSALGHTGRPLVAGRLEITIFAAIHAAAITRVFGPLLAPGHYPAWLELSGALWTLAFATFAVGYWPILTRPRIDQISQ